MRKSLSVGLLALCVLMANGGCVVVAKHKGPIGGSACCRQAVAVDGQIYVVDVHGGYVTKLDAQSVAEAKPFTSTPCTHTWTVDDED